MEPIAAMYERLKQNKEAFMVHERLGGLEDSVKKDGAHVGLYGRELLRDMISESVSADRELMLMFGFESSMEMWEAAQSEHYRTDITSNSYEWIHDHPSDVSIGDVINKVTDGDGYAYTRLESDGDNLMIIMKSVPGAEDLQFGLDSYFDARVLLDNLGRVVAMDVYAGVDPDGQRQEVQIGDLPAQAFVLSEARRRIDDEVSICSPWEDEE